MKITTKINLLTTAWLLIILSIINIVVYVSFLEMTVSLEKEAVSKKAEMILKKLSEEDSKGNENMILSAYLVDHSFIRLINPDNTIRKQLSNDPELSKREPEFTRKDEAFRIKTFENNREEEGLITRTPIKKDGRIIGTLEIGERMAGFETRKDWLKAILIACTLIAAALSLLGGKWLAGLIIKPVSRMIGTMEDIEKSGVLKPIVRTGSANDELEKMAATFNRMILRLQENSERQKQFVSDASHELKTPLTVIKSYSDLLRRRGTEDKEMTLDAANTIYAEASRIQKMAEYLLDLADAEKENTLNIEETDLVLLCESLLKHLRQAYKRRLILHSSAESILLPADKLKLEQVLIIVLDNAMKYSKEKIDVFIESNGNKVIIRIQDYGIGIPKEEARKVFERFYRVDKARSRETGGTGLGLSIAKNIVSLHSGKIEINSEAGKGTEVRISLPLR
ncbi:HAMP domain-containing histidine kinase [Metabacillus sp. GX 13764]|uniref:HAMP domain-containing sensor histidine kinase n=1 Tax=Metabacillus kandeliae TaxID=2900151 RepID=UPI001E5AB560|nr:HAMP domain-containing histidine kinase [Metabacillus kandeliae]MCD7035672.1 HAMP domain-containing histidine kinase [Metabacillus kandeliae]